MMSALVPFILLREKCPISLDSLKESKVYKKKKI